MKRIVQFSCSSLSNLLLASIWTSNDINVSIRQWFAMFTDWISTLKLTSLVFLYRSVATGDVNGDQYEDLIIGAPGYGQEGLSQIGRVYVVYGNDKIFDKGSIDLDQEADVILQGLHVSINNLASHSSAIKFTVMEWTHLDTRITSWQNWRMTQFGRFNTCLHEHLIRETSQAPGNWKSFCIFESICCWISTWCGNVKGKLSLKMLSPNYLWMSVCLTGRRKVWISSGSLGP